MILAIIVVVGSFGPAFSAVSPSDYKSARVFEQMGALMEMHGESLVKEQCVRRIFFSMHWLSDSVTAVGSGQNSHT